ncbi:MAG: hypothetical protein MUC56_09785 [Thermoanaerobaculales bacterium]|jgi:hypothetical protein|nr:hypothetical protein [Thermoanaerobaculales bacterium]
MTPSARLGIALVGLAALLCSCGGNGLEGQGREVAPTPRKLTVWLDADGVDAETAARLADAGVDRLAVRRGAILLGDAAPVVRLLPSPPVEGTLPVGVVLEVRGLATGGGGDAAAAVWSALEADFGEALPAELILDLPELGPAATGFVTRLGHSSGLAVIPVLTVAQLDSEAGRELADACHRCIVPVSGVQPEDLRGLEELGTQRLDVRLASARELGVKVRVAAALRPRTDPEVGGWAADVDGLTVPENADLKRASVLDRSFVVHRPLSWAGRSFRPGETIAVAWVDVARLGLFFAESHRTVLPEIAGWDLVTLPPAGANLGLDREELLSYLLGDGPGPEVAVSLVRDGRLLTVRMTNPGIFRSAVTSIGNWLQVELDDGSLVPTSAGDFDGVSLGTVRGGEWRPNPPGAPDAARWVETYIAPGESLATGSIRLPSNRSRVRVRYQVQLSDGSAVRGVVD